MAFSHSNKEEQVPAKYEEYPAGWAYPPPMYAYPQQQEEKGILDYFRAAWSRKWQVLLCAVLGLALGFIVTKMTPTKYRAEATLLAITSSGGGLGGIASQISSVPMVGGALGDLGKLGGGKSKELVNILKSRTLSEKVVRKYDLMKVIFADQYDPKSDTYFAKFPTFFRPVPVLQDAVAKFRSKVAKVDEDKKTTLIKISVSLKDPVLAAKVANQMIMELQDFIENNALTISKRNRIFLEEQLVRTRVKLLESGKELNQFYSENKISSVVPEIDVNVGTFQSAPKPFADFQEELEKLSQEEKALEEKRELARVGRVPGQVYLQFLTLSRELQVRVYGLLTQQYELAKIEEAKEDLAFQVIDKAEVKERPSSPRLVVNLGAGLMAGLFLGILIALVRDMLQQEKLKARKVVG